MRTIPAGDLPSIDPIEGFRFWGKQPFSRRLLQSLSLSDESNNVKPVSGLWASPLMHGHTDCWEEFLDSVGWYDRIPHCVELDPSTPVMLLDSDEDLDEYAHLHCTPSEYTHLLYFDPSKFLDSGHTALYISRRGIRSSRHGVYGLGNEWDVPSLWVNDPLGIYLQRVEPESTIGGDQSRIDSESSPHARTITTGGGSRA